MGSRDSFRLLSDTDLPITAVNKAHGLFLRRINTIQVQWGELLQPSPLTCVHELIIWLLSTISPEYDEYLLGASYLVNVKLN